MVNFKAIISSVKAPMETPTVYEIFRLWIMDVDYENPMFLVIS